MTLIDVERVDAGTFDVRVTEGGSTSTHHVEVHRGDRDLVGTDVETEDLIEASFRFLLDREPRESILSRFDLSMIAHYFPEYPDRVEDYL